ncbi:MAG: DUF4349 domain-containing protein [Chloroflexi bacterium]|nr:DUF4349 domain-containing protein [Chloroflexota bacterium]
MAQQPASPRPPARRSNRKLIVVAAAILFLVIAVPVVAALALTPWSRSAAVQGDRFSTGDSGASFEGTLGPRGDDGLFPLSTGAPRPSAVAVPTPTPAPRAPSAGGAFNDTAVFITSADKQVSPLEIAQRQIIAQASLTVEVEAVPAAVAQVQAIATGLGGFVEQLSSSGSEDKQFANITIRLPQPEFYKALDQLRALGKVQGENLGSQDVTDQFIDLQARLKSLLAEEISLLALLGKAQQISDILTIERELSRVRSDIERYQGQLNYLERRVDLASISISLVPPGLDIGQPPQGALTVEVERAAASADAVKALAARLNGEIDSIFVSTRQGRSRADISFRVFTKDFTQAVTEIEGEGAVLSKEVREGKPGKQQAKTPDANVFVALVEPEPEGTWDRVLAIALWAGGGAAVVIVALAMFGLYRLGKRRGAEEE